MSDSISHVVLRKCAVKADPRISDPTKNGRRVLVNEIRENETPITNPEWTHEVLVPGPAGGLVARTPVHETGEGGVEVATFTQAATQDRHYHEKAMETYTVLEGKMTIRIAGAAVVLDEGDEIIVLPGTCHEVVPADSTFLVRVHATPCWKGDKHPCDGR